MRDVPNVLIIEKSRFPASVPVEECERVGKTPDNKNAIIRYQRRTDVSVVKQISRFFSDLFNGVTRARGRVCDKRDLPNILNIRGERFTITKDAGSSKALLAAAPAGQARQRASRPELTIEVRESPLLKCDPALAHKVAEELRDRFEVGGQAADLIAVENFLAMDAEPNFEVTPVRVVQLMQFSDALGRMSGTLKRELGADVQSHVLDRMQHWQDRIAKVEAQGPGGAKPAYPDFRFKGLSAFGASAADTAPNRPAEALHQPQPQAQVQPQAQPLPQPQAQPLPELQRPPQVQPRLKVQHQPEAQPLPEIQPLPEDQPLPDLQPQSHVQPPLRAQHQPELQALPEIERLPQDQPLPDLQPRSYVQPPLQAQREPEAAAEPQPQATQTQAPVPVPEPALAPPPPPPPPPPAIKPAVPTATASAGPDATALTTAASRLKPVASNPPQTQAPAAKDDSLLSILTSAMVGRRADVDGDANNKQDDNDDDEWK